MSNYDLVLLDEQKNSVMGFIDFNTYEMAKSVGQIYCESNYHINIVDFVVIRKKSNTNQKSIKPLKEEWYNEFKGLKEPKWWQTGGQDV